MFGPLKLNQITKATVTAATVGSPGCLFAPRRNLTKARQTGPTIFGQASMLFGYEQFGRSAQLGPQTQSSFNE